MMTRRMNKLTAVFMAFILMLTAFPYSIGATEQEKSDNIIYISTVQDLENLAKNCRLDTWSHDKTVILDKDIDLANREFIPIPTFGGIFEGKGHTISGLLITAEGSYQGLFRYIQENAVVRGLNVHGTVKGSGTSEYIGGIAGSNSGMVSGCKFVGICEGKNYTGGIAGVNEAAGTIYDSATEGMVYAEHYVGGTAGINLGILESNSNSASVNTLIEQMDIKLTDISVDTFTTTEDAADITDVGGITGYSAGIIKNCTNLGVIGYQHKGYNIGGIAGRQSGYITESVNYGKIYGRKEVGGIAGQVEPYRNLEFSESVITQLRKKTDQLQSNINTMIDDSRNYSDSVTDRLDSMSGYADSASDALDTLMNKTETMLREDVSQVNSLSMRIGKSIDMLTFVTDDMSDAADDMQDTLEHLKKAADKLTSGSDDAAKTGDIVSDAFKLLGTNSDSLQSASEHIDMAQKYLDAGNSVKAREELSAALDDLQDSVTGVDEAVDKLAEAEPYIRNLQASAQDAAGEFKDTAGYLSDAHKDITASVNGIKDIIRYLSDEPDFVLSDIDSTYTDAREQFTDSISSISDVLKDINDTVKHNNNVIADDIQAISDTLFEISDILMDAWEDAKDKSDSGKENGNIQNDISEDDDESNTQGKVSHSVNYGFVEGDVNVGGICGAMSIEHDLDPEDDIDISGDVSTKFDYSMRAVARDCANYGGITGKKDCTGGIAGLAELGCIIGCRGFGKITATDGNYVGGIAGISKSLIRDCYAKCELSGGSYIGGIAGTGNDIRNCYTLVKVTDYKEAVGAVAGKVTGTMEGNYFVHSDISGVDGVSYAGRAEPLTYDELCAVDGIPEEFTSMKLTFKADDAIVYIYDFRYGDAFDKSGLPAIPEKEGYQADWEDYDYSFLTFDATIEAQYSSYVNSIESETMRTKDKAVVIVEGSFSDNDKLSMSPLMAAELPEGQENAAECWRIDIPDDRNAEHVIHYLPPDSVKRVSIEILENGEWHTADTGADGKYVTFEASGSEIIIRVVNAPLNPVVIVAAIVIVLILVAVILTVIRKKKRKASTFCKD